MPARMRKQRRICYTLAMSDEILFHEEGGIATLRFNRPQARNALNWAAQEQFAARIAAVARQPQIRVLILTGVGPAFVAGGDLKELSQGDFEANGQRLSRVMSGALAQMARLPIPVIAAINGPAVGGGCEIALACDLRLAAAGASLSFAQARLGLTTGWGGAARLCALLGRSRATGILLMARSLSAEEALAIGLLHAIAAEGEDVLALARERAQELVAMSPQALAAMKQLLYRPSEQEEQAAAQLERRLFNRLWGSAAHRAAMDAFLGRPTMAEQEGDATRGTSAEGSG